MALTVLQPIYIIRLDIATDPVQVWTGPGIFAPTGTGDTALDGYTFDSAPAVLSLSDAIESSENGSPLTLTAPASELDEVILRQVVRDKRQYQGRKAWIWLGFLDTDDDTSVLSSPPIRRIKFGHMLSISITEDAENGGSASLIVDVDQGRARGRNMRVQDHNRIWDGEDTFGNYVQPLANRPQGITGSADRTNAGIVGGNSGSWDSRNFRIH